MSVLSSGIDWVDDIDIAALDADPYPLFARMRAEAPCVFVPAVNAYLVTTYDDVRALLSDTELCHVPDAETLPVLARTFGPNNILVSNGEIHRDRRASVDPPLRRREVAGYIDELIRPMARELAERLPSSAPFDIVAEYLEPVSTRGLATMLGMGEATADTLRRWQHTVVESCINYAFLDDPFERKDKVFEEIRDLVEPILVRLESEPDNSGLSHLLHAGMPTGQLRPREDVYSALMVELIGGMQEPGHAAATTLLGLLQEGTYGEIVEDPDLIAEAIAEGLRWIAPIGAVFRQTTKDTVVHDQAIPAGTMLYCMASSANRDEQKFIDGEQYQLHRRGPTHLSFGGGQHFCAGNVFGRELARITLEELVKVAPGLRQAEESPQMRGWLFRAPQVLPVVLKGA